MDAPGLRPLCRIRVELAAPLELGTAPGGRRRIVPIVGGTVEGERLKGKVIGVGADWQTVHADRSAEISAHYALETDDGAIVEIRNEGVRHGPPEVIDALFRGEEIDPSRYYMRTTARLTTGDARYDWLNRIVTVGVGARERSTVRIDLYEVL